MQDSQEIQKLRIRSEFILNTIYSMHHVLSIKNTLPSQLSHLALSRLGLLTSKGNQGSTIKDEKLSGSFESADFESHFETHL